VRGWTLPPRTRKQLDTAEMHRAPGTIGLHRLQNNSLRNPEGRSWLKASDFDDAQVLRQATLIRMMSIMESFWVSPNRVPRISGSEIAGSV
jgi:hypothetical protein